MQRCSDAVLEAGGDTVVIAGDLFHARGSIKPSVFNKAVEFFKKNKKVRYQIIAGNHDLETKVSTDTSSALTPLDTIPNVFCHSEPVVSDSCILIPWIEAIQLDDIKAVLDRVEDTENKDVILHAPIDGVFDNIPSAGLSPKELETLPVRRVFSGHFHNHKKLNNKVWSIGSIAQFSFGEKDNTVGFMLVYPDMERFCPSEEPRFVECDFTDLKTVSIKGEYLKVRLNADLKQAQIEKLRQKLIDVGVKGVIFQTVKQAVQREESSVEAGASLEVSVSEYVSRMKNKPFGLSENCLRVLSLTED